MASATLIGPPERLAHSRKHDPRPKYRKDPAGSQVMIQRRLPVWSILPPKLSPPLSGISLFPKICLSLARQAGAS